MLLLKRKKQSGNVPARRRYTYSATGVAHDKETQQRDRKAVQFKRGRTLAGSTSARIRATETTALQAATPREKVHHLSNVRRKLMGVFVAVLVLALLLAGIIWQFSAGVLVQLDELTTQPEAKQYESTIQSYLAENPTERLRFNLNEKRLSEYVHKNHTEVERVTQGGFSSPAKTVFTVKLRNPVASWQVDGGQYFVDAYGVSFTKNMYDDPQVTIVDNSGVRHTPGTAIASERFLGFVGRAVALGHENQLAIKSASIPAGTSRQVELTVDGVEYPIILSIDRPVGEQIEDALRAVQHFTNTGKKPTYVDIRVKGRAFFRE